MTVALLGMWAVLPMVSAAAAVQAFGADGTEGVSTGSWGVVPTQSSSMPPPVGALSLTASNNNPQYFQAVNVGTLPLVALSYSVGITSSANTTMTLTACSVPWNQGGGGGCAGTKTTIGNWSSQMPVPKGHVAGGASLTSTVVPATGNGQVSIQAKPGGVPTGGATFTVNTTVESGPTRQIRAAQTSNS